VKLFQRTSEGFHRFVEQENTNYFIDDGVCDTLPLAAHPAESTKTLRNNLQAINHYTMADLPAPTADDLPEFSEDETDHIYRATNIIAASDSSVDPISGEATFNWRITTYDKRGLISKSSFVNSNPMYMNSYRGEMAGIQDLVEWMHSTELRKKVLKIVCDNESCVKSINRQGFSLIDLDKAESDLIRDITIKLKNFDDVTVEWVKGHQDNNIAYDDLPIESQLNIDCDAAAKLHLREGTKPKHPNKPAAGYKAMLYLGGYMVTTNMNEQIQMAGQARKMLAYAADKFGWTDNQAIATVNWRAIGRAKRSLKLSPSVRTSKMMYDWLNVGSQKKKMGGDSICPCCGIEEEDQLHLYRCTNEQMQATLKDSIAATNTRLVKEGLITPVYTAFINCICEATNQPPLSSYIIEDEEALRCIQSQETLGMESILRGFHHIDWLHLLRDKWVKPRVSEDGQKKERRKDPLEQSVVLVKCVWDIFEAQWKCRNDILHSNDSALIERSRDTLTTRLLEFKRNNRSLLRSCDRFIIDNHSIQDVIKWPLQRKKATLDFLEHLHKIYSGEVKDEAASYRDISNYFIKLPPKDTAPPALSHDNSIDDSKDSDSDSDTTISSSSSSEESTDDEFVRHPRQQRLWRGCLFESSSESSFEIS
jgi:ribonuclease HI